MNLIGTALERSEQNPFYAEFKKKNPTISDEKYEWKCWMLKKYFHDNIVINLIKIVIGIVMLILAGSSKVFKILGNKGFGSIAVVVCLVLGIILVGTGIMLAVSNQRCKKNFSDYLWDEESDGEEENITTKIINFYNRK